MGTQARRIFGLVTTGTTAICLSVFLAVLPSDADDKFWVGGSGSWDEGSYWNPIGQPLNGDSVYLTHNDALTRDIYYRNTLYPDAMLNFLGIGTTGTGKTTLKVNQDVLNVGSESIGYAGGAGYVAQTGGVHNVVGNLYVGAHYVIPGGYQQDQGLGTYSLTGGTLSTNQTWIGDDGKGFFFQSGGTHTADYLFVGGNVHSNGRKDGYYNLSGGSLTVAGESIGDFAGGYFTQTGGTHVVNGRLIIDYDGRGRYVLSGGSLTAQSEVLGIRRSGGAGDPIFLQTGGVHTVKDLVMGGEVAMTPSVETYTLTGGTLNVEREVIGYNGRTTVIPSPHLEPGSAGPYATFTQTGGVHTVSDSLTTLYQQSTYNLQGGILNASSFLNYGTLNYTGGDLKANLTNSGTTNLGGTGVRVIEGNIINNGTFKTTNTSAVYTGTFTNNGAYISDPAVQRFNNLIIGQTGYLQGGIADFFLIGGNLVNYSTMNTDWNTSLAYLGFVDGTSALHDLYLTGADFGASLTGYKDNFSWGVLDLIGDSLTLYDGNDVTGGALYVGGLWGLDINGKLITNITGMDGFDIYYLASLPGNEYLHGWTYDLTGGGHLIPVGTQAVPEPSILLLLGTGLAGLGGMAWRRHRRG